MLIDLNLNSSLIGFAPPRQCIFWHPASLATHRLAASDWLRCRRILGATGADNGVEVDVKGLWGWPCQPKAADELEVPALAVFGVGGGV